MVQRFERACNGIEETARELAEMSAEFMGLLPNEITEHDCKQAERINKVLLRLLIAAKKMEV